MGFSNFPCDLYSFSVGFLSVTRKGLKVVTQGVSFRGSSKVDAVASCFRGPVSD